jgi:serine/threonine-protein kinase
MWRGGKSFFSASKETAASVMPMTNTSAPKTTTPEKVELSNPVPTALETASSSGGQAPSLVQSTAVQSTPVQSTQVTPLATTKTTTKTTSARATTPPTKIAQVVERTPIAEPQPVARRNNVAVAVQGESALNSAVAEVLTAELSSAGLEVKNADDMPATEGMAGSASSGALVNRLRGHAGVLVIARIEPAGERELHYMGRTDTAYSSRVNVIVYDVASGNPIGTRASGTIEYTSLNASQKAEQVIGPLARKAVEAIQNR